MLEKKQLKGVKLLGSFVLDFEDFSVGSLSDIVDDVVVFEGDAELMHHHSFHNYYEIMCIKNLDYQ